MSARGKHKLAGIAAGAAISLFAAGTAFAGTWQSSNQGWIYLGDDGLPVTNQWVMDEGNMYSLDENGQMRIGWMNSDGFWCFLDTRIGGPQGGLMTGWQWIDGRCYYLDPMTGIMAASTITPDGYLVDANGAWVNEFGIPYYEEGKGISSTEVIDLNDFEAWSNSAAQASGNIYDTDYYWYDYDDDSVSFAVNDLYKGNYDLMSSSERNAVDKEIKKFKDEYITSDMSDFEKELEIVQWIVENCSYKSGSGWTYATAYSCIVGGKAQCAGYADAFLQMADACGLTVRYVCNSTHAWNMIKLDGDWYHVDVTWEDPTGAGNNYGFGNLRNMYINLTDSVIQTASSHKTWSSSAPKANGTKYGPDAVSEALKKYADTVELTVNYVDAKGNVVGVQTGTAYVGYPITLEYPEGYEARNAGMPEMHVISGTFTQRGTEITPTSKKACEINITVTGDGKAASVDEEAEEISADEKTVVKEEEKAEVTITITEADAESEDESEDEARAEMEAESKPAEESETKPAEEPETKPAEEAESKPAEESETKPAEEPETKPEEPETKPVVESETNFNTNTNTAADDVNTAAKTGSKEAEQTQTSEVKTLEVNNAAGQQTVDGEEQSGLPVFLDDEGIAEDDLNEV